METTKTIFNNVMCAKNQCESLACLLLESIEIQGSIHDSAKITSSST